MLPLNARRSYIRKFLRELDGWEDEEWLDIEVMSAIRKILDGKENAFPGLNELLADIRKWKKLQREEEEAETGLNDD